MRRICCLLAHANLSVVLFVAIGCGPKSVTSDASGGPVAPPASPLKEVEFKTTAEAMAKEAIADEKAFNAKYKDKVVEVEGQVQFATAWISENGFSMVGAKKKPTDVVGKDLICTVLAEQKPKALRLGKGQKVKVVGQVLSGDAMGVYLDRCTVTELEPNPIPTMRAEDMAAEFAQDAEAAKTKYGIADMLNKEIFIDGTVVDLVDSNTNFGERRSIILTGRDGVVIDVDCAVHKHLTAGLKKGDKVMVKGEISDFDKVKKSVNVGLAYVEKQN